MGNWSYGSISSDLNGEITIRNINFTPKNYSQGIEIGSINISTEPMFLLKSNPSELTYILPDSLSISVNNILLNSKSNDIYESFKERSLWMMLAGYAGSFGCSKDQFTSFDDEIWSQIIPNDQIYNVDLYFSRQQDSSLDVDLILDAENMFSSTWSSNLKSSYNENQVVLDELLVDKLYYSYLDSGFNLARNNACIQNYKSSFAAYRLSSAEHLQKFLRINYSKELPSTLINSYQRLLSPDTEYNAIITLDDRKYLSDVYHTSQLDLFENSMVEISTSKNEYIPINLKEIDYTKLDTDHLIAENIKKDIQDELDKKNTRLKNPSIQKTRVVRTGGSDLRNIAVNNISSAIDKRVRIKTIRGRPVIGIVRSINNNLITLNSSFKTGKATITIPIDMISSVELL
jgi:hypothetical protein